MLLSRPSRRRRDQEIVPRNQGGGGATFQSKAETARLFRPKKSRQTKIWSQSLDIDRESLNIPKFGRESLDKGCKSLDIPKFGRESLEMVRKSLHTGSRDPCPECRDQILVCPDFRGPRSDSSPDFPDSKSRRDQAIWV